MITEQQYEKLKEHIEGRVSFAAENRSVTNITDENKGTFWYGYSVGVSQVLEYMEILESMEIDDGENNDD